MVNLFLAICIAVFCGAKPLSAQNNDTDSTGHEVTLSVGSLGAAPSFGALQIMLTRTAFAYAAVGNAFGAIAVGRVFPLCEDSSRSCIGLAGSGGVGVVERKLFPALLVGAFASLPLAREGPHLRPGVQILVPAFYPMITLGIAFRFP